MTSTYQKRRLGKKPKLTVYIDGPFYPTGDTAKEKVSNLRNTVFTSMTENSKKSNYCYVEYKTAENF